MKRPERDGVGLSLFSSLASVNRYFPSALIVPKVANRVGLVTKLLPAALSRRLYLECRLGADATQVDFIVCVNRDNGAWFTEEGQRHWLPRNLQRHTAWSAIAKMCSQWAATVDPRYAGVHDLWLEFDVEDDSATLVPNVFFGLSGSVAHAAAFLLGGGDGARNRASIARCLNCVPAGTSVLYAGMMYPRNPNTVRLCLKPFTGERLVQYLAAVGWPGSLRKLQGVLEGIQVNEENNGFKVPTMLHIDVSDTVEPNLGLEFPLAQRPQIVRSHIIEDSFLTALCDHGLCTSVKREALLTWPGHTVQWLAHECWPSVILRRVSHVKLIYAQDELTLAKTYLSMFHGFSRSHVCTTLNQVQKALHSEL